MPKVSIIMPCYNEESTIQKSIYSILNQSFKDFEFIIVDDCSTDNTINEINKIKDNRIKLIKHTSNCGVARALNTGLKECKGKYIARMDADDICDKYRIEMQVKYLDKHPEVILCGSWCKLITENEEKYIKIPIKDKKIKEYMQKDNPFIHSTVMFKSKIEGFDLKYNEIKGFEDYQLWIEMGKYGKLANIDKYLVTRYDYNNFETKKTWDGISKIDVYQRRFEFQKIAIKYYGMNIKSPLYLLKTILSIKLREFKVLK